MDFRAHSVEQYGKVRDFRFTGAVLHDGLTIGKRGGHQHILCAGDGNFVERNFGAFEPIPFERISDGLDVAMLLRDFGAQTFQSFDVEIDGAGADGASAGQRDAGAATAGYERSQNECGGPHRLDQLIRRLGRGERACANCCPMMGASVAEFDLSAHCRKKLARGLDVAHLRDVFKNHRFVGEQGCRHARQRRVLRATDADSAEQRVATSDYELIHTVRFRKSGSPSF